MNNKGYWLDMEISEISSAVDVQSYILEFSILVLDIICQKVISY